MNKKISTIEELEREQEKLKMLMEVTKQEFVRSIGTNKTQLKDFMVKKVVLPAGAVGVGLSAVSKLNASNNNKNQGSNKAGLGLISALAPLVLNLFQSFFDKKNNEDVNGKISNTSKNNAKVKLQSVA